MTINTLGLFLRGGAIEQSQMIQMDAIKEHSHAAVAHGHSDLGHSHEDRGHTHEFPAGKAQEVLRPGATYGDRDGTPGFGDEFDVESKTNAGFANIQVIDLVLMFPT